MTNSSNFNKIFLKKISINIAILLIIWFAFYGLIRKIPTVDFLYEEAIFYLTKIQLYLSKYFLQIFHYKIAIIGKTIKIIPSDGVHLDRGCLGRNTLGVFAIFILAFPGKFIQKIWFIIVGTAIFILMNVSRIVALAITDYCCPQHLNFNHHFLFKIIIYAVILLLWAWWINRYSMLKNKK